MMMIQVIYFIFYFPMLFNVHNETIDRDIIVADHEKISFRIFIV